MTTDSQRAAQRRYYLKTVEERRAYQREYYHQNKDEINEKIAARKSSDPELREKRREYSREYHLSHRDERNAKMREYSRKTPAEVKMLRAARYRAKQGGFPCTITLADIVIPARCPILDIELIVGDGHATANSPTLDKISPELGYVPGNVQVISYMANSMKRDASWEDLRKFAEWVLSYEYE